MGGQGPLSLAQGHMDQMLRKTHWRVTSEGFALSPPSSSSLPAWLGQMGKALPSGA